MFGKDMIIKGLSSMLKSHLDKSKDGKLVVSLSEIKKYMDDNHKEFHSSFQVVENDVKIILEKPTKQA